MTEQKDFLDADVVDRVPETEWPGDTVRTGDESVDAVLGRLDSVAQVPLGEHSGLYSGMHDALLAALNADSASAAHAVASASGLTTTERGGA